MGVNGDANIDAYSSNQTIVAPSADVVAESQQTVESSTFAENESSSPPLDSGTTNTDLAPPSTSLEENNSILPDPRPSASDPESTISTAINAAVEDNTVTSSVPPVVEAQESDVRDTTLPPAPAPDTEPRPSDLTFNEESETLTAVEKMDDSALAAAHVTFDAAATDPSPSAVTDQQLQTPPTDLGPGALPPAELEKPSSTTQSQDIDMVDAPAPTTKVAREREDDIVVEPSAKRAKTEDDVKVSADAEAQPALSNGEAKAAKPESARITPYVSKEIVKVLKNCLRTNAGKNFRASVRELWPGFADAYEAKVPNPIDLSIIENKVKAGQYATMDDFKADINLVHSNAVLFNGNDHVISVAGKDVRDSILSKVAAIPAEPVATPKAIKNKPRRSTPVTEASSRVTPVRRPSRSAGTAAATPHAQTFALDPATSTPLIRRDSTKEPGGRPKREIHPPKNKDLIYSVRPKSKKFATELRFCEEVLNEIKKPKYLGFVNVFLDPVDPVASNIPNYFTVIKNPMDLSTVAKKLNSGDYARAKDFEQDMRQIVWNCLKFNPEGNAVRQLGLQFEDLFNAQWAKKDQYIQNHTPAALSPSSSAGDEDEESEEEEEAETQSLNSAATLRLIEEQNKLITLMASKKTDPAIVSMQQDMVDFLKQKVEEENARAPPAKKATKKSKPPKATKKAGPIKKTGGGNKKGGNKRERYLGTLEKEVISAGLGELPDAVSASVLDMIKKDQPNVDVCLRGCDLISIY